MINSWHLRRFQLINLSLQKTGTKSIAGIFENFRSAHEFQHDAATSSLYKYRNAELDENGLCAFLMARDAIGQLEVDSASFNGWFAEQYMRIFPNAKFLIMLRHPVEWLDSVLTHIQRDVNYTLNAGQPYPMRFKRQASLSVGSFSPELFADEEALKNALPQLSNELLTHWETRNAFLINVTTSERRLILNSENLTSSLPRLAAFVGVSSDELLPCNAHLHRKPNHPTVLQTYNFKPDADRAIKIWDRWQANLI